MSFVNRLSGFLLFSQVYWLPRYYTLFRSGNIIKNELVLDAGCGEGILDLGLAKKGARVVAVDSSIEVIMRAKELLKNFKPLKNIQFIVADLHDLPFAGDRFDRIVCLDVLESVKDDQAVLREFSRVLKPLSKLMLSLPQGYACSARLFHSQRSLRKIIPRSFFSKDLPGGRSWLQADDDCLMRKLSDVRKYSLQEIKDKTEALYRLSRFDYFLKTFSSLAMDITYGIKGLSRFKFLFFSIGVRLDRHFLKNAPGYGLFVELIKK